MCQSQDDDDDDDDVDDRYTRVNCGTTFSEEVHKFEIKRLRSQLLELRCFQYLINDY